MTAAFAAVGGGPKLYGKGGFWEGVRWRSFYRLRPTVRLALGLLGMSFAIFALPVLLGLLLGILASLLLIADRVFPGAASRVLSLLWVSARGAERPVPRGAGGARLRPRRCSRSWRPPSRTSATGGASRRRSSRSWTPTPGLERLKRSLWEVARGAALSGGPPSEAELGRRYVALLSENLGEPGFRELVLRAADLDRGDALAFVLLRDGQRRLPARERVLAEAVDLRASGHDALLFDALATGLLCPMAMPLRRVSLPKGAPHAGETHRLTDATLAGGQRHPGGPRRGGGAGRRGDGRAGEGGPARAPPRPARPPRRRRCGRSSGGPPRRSTTPGG